MSSKFASPFMAKSPLRKEEPKDEDNLEYTTKSDSGMSDAEYAKYFSEGSIHRPNLDEVVVTAPRNKKIGETALGTQYPQQDSLSEAIYKATGRVVPQSKPPENNNLTQERADELAKAFEKDSFIKQAGTLVSNPVQGLKALGNQMSYNYVTDEFGNYSSDPALDSLTNLRRAKESGRSIQGDELNTAGQIGMLAAGALGALGKANTAVNAAQNTRRAKVLSSLKNPLTTQTYLDAASGDFTGLGLKFLPKAIRGKLKKPAKSLYYGYKTSKIR